MTHRDEILHLQRSAGNAAVRHLLSRLDPSPSADLDGGGSGEPAVQRADPLPGLAALDELLNRFDVPEQEVITHLRGLSDAEQALVRNMASYKSRIAAAMNAAEMIQCVDALRAPLPIALDWMLAAGAGYSHVKPRVLAATAAERADVLQNQPLLASLRDELWWHDFARTMELLGRTVPDRAALLATPAVQAQLQAAWVRSNPGVRVVPVKGPLIHEEGGAIYLNLITNELSFQLWSGGPADFSDRMPPYVEDSIIVGTFHTHPQLGADFVRTPSPADLATGDTNGVPGLIRSEENGEPVYYEYGPDVRLHLAGVRGLRSWSYPGPSGGEPP